MAYANVEDQRRYAREYSRRRRQVDEVYRLKTNQQANKWDTSPKQRPYKLLRAAKVRATKAQLQFDLDSNWVRQHWTGRCELTGIPFDIVNNRGRQIRSPSIDRIDQTRGYTKDNCRYILWAINSMKCEGTDSDIYEIAEALIRNKKNAS